MSIQSRNYELTDTIILSWDFGTNQKTNFTYTFNNLSPSKPDLIRVRGATLDYPSQAIANGVISTAVNIKSDMIDKGRILVSIPSPDPNVAIVNAYPAKKGTTINDISYDFVNSKELNNNTFTFYVIPDQNDNTQVAVYGSLRIFLEFYKKL